jgi:hypothetical protein
LQTADRLIVDCELSVVCTASQSSIRNPQSAISDLQSSIISLQSLVFPSARLLQRTTQDEFDLAVQAAQIVVCPALNGLQHVAVDTEEERLPISHGSY